MEGARGRDFRREGRGESARGEKQGEPEKWTSQKMDRVGAKEGKGDKTMVGGRGGGGVRETGV